MRKEYLADLEGIRNEIIVMGDKTAQAIEAAARALMTLDGAEAQAARQYEKAVDSMNAVVDKTCIVTIATQAPAATDVRFIVASLKIASEIERIADYANNIGKTVQKRLTATGMKPVAELMPEMKQLGEGTAQMLRQAMEAFRQSDAGVAAVLSERDKEINAIYKSIQSKLPYVELTTPEEQAAFLEFNNAVRYLERAGDRATNIGEWVFYIATGFPAAKKVKDK